MGPKIGEEFQERIGSFSSISFGPLLDQAFSAPRLTEASGDEPIVSHLGMDRDFKSSLHWTLIQALIWELEPSAWVRHGVLSVLYAPRMGELRTPVVILE